MDGTERLLASDARIAVAGAGSIGCFIGGLLAHAGRRVTFLARPHMVEEVTAHGLHGTNPQPGPIGAL